MPIRQIEYNSPQYDQMIKLRDEILKRPLGLSFSRKQLEEESKDLFIGAFEDDEMIGCCVLTPIDAFTIRLRQMAVQNNLQHKGIGRTILAFAENISRDKGFKTLTMHARKTVTSFYKKQGYKIIGDEFTEVSLPHFIMTKEL